jgi:hypothetical protein
MAAGPQEGKKGRQGCGCAIVIDGNASSIRDRCQCLRPVALDAQVPQVSL